MIIIKYFGAIADITQKKEEQFQTVDSLYELQSEIESQYPEIKTIRYSLALNQSIVKEDAELNDNDEIALLPPFAGG